VIVSVTDHYLCLLHCIAADGTYLSFAKGDLLLLSDEINGEMVMNQAFAHAENIRTGEMGDFISENVHILPTITKPTLALQVGNNSIQCNHDRCL
jgi:hypothetical protein